MSNKYVDDLGMQENITKTKEQLSLRPTIFKGTRNEWDALTLTQKLQYQMFALVDGSEPTPPTPVTSKINLNGFDTTDMPNIYPIHQNRTMFMLEDFDGDELETDIVFPWTSVETNHKVTAFLPEQAIVSDSVLHIKGETKEVTYDGTTYPYAGASLQSRYWFQECLIEYKIRIPSYAANWVHTIWSTGMGAVNWPNSGEFDFFETNTNDGKTPNTSFHYANNGWSHATTMAGTTIDTTTNNNFRNNLADGDWHVVGYEMHNGVITLYMDGVAFRTYDTTNTNFAEGINPYLYGMCLIFSSSSWSNTATGNVEFDIDWIRAWSLENKTSADITPESVDIIYPGTQGRCEPDGKVVVGVAVAFYPDYTPDYVPLIGYKNSNSPMYTISDESIASVNASSGCVRFAKAGSVTLTYTDSLGITATKDLIGYEMDLPTGDVALEDFDVTTANVRYLRYGTSEIVGKNFSDLQLSTTDLKGIRYGEFSVEPSTTYNFTRAQRNYNETMWIIELDSSKKILKSTSVTNNASITTQATTASVYLQGNLSSSLVIADLFRIRAMFRGIYKPAFTKA